MCRVNRENSGMTASYAVNSTLLTSQHYRTNVELHISPGIYRRSSRHRKPASGGIVLLPACDVYAAARKVYRGLWLCCLAFSFSCSAEAVVLFFTPAAPAGTKQTIRW